MDSIIIIYWWSKAEPLSSSVQIQNEKKYWIADKVYDIHIIYYTVYTNPSYYTMIFFPDDVKMLYIYQVVNVILKLLSHQKVNRVRNI